MVKRKKLPAVVLSREEDRALNKISELFRKTRFTEADRLVKKFAARYPGNFQFPYLEAVLVAEDTVGLKPAQVNLRYRKASRMLLAILQTYRLSPRQRGSVLNEYYWFSRLPRKQYALGVRLASKGFPNGHYSQGVGANRLALAYAKAGRGRLARRWAEKSKSSWEAYFLVRPEWANSYYFYAQSLGLLGDEKGMERALFQYAKLSGRRRDWAGVRECRQEFTDARKKLKE